MINPVRWVTRQAATGLIDLPRNSAWLLSRALSAPLTVAGATGDGLADGPPTMRATAAASLQGARDSVESRLRIVKDAVTRARQSELEALTATQHVKTLADAALAADEAGTERVRQATLDAALEVERRAQSAREHFADLLAKERAKAGRKAAEAVERVTADVRRSVDRARGVAAAAAEIARDQISHARKQSAVARSLAAEATAVAERVANEVHQQAEAIAEYARRRAKVADATVDKARRTQGSLSGGSGTEVSVAQTESTVI